MPGFGDFYNKKNKKKSKDELAKSSSKSSFSTSSWTLPQPEVIKKKKREDW